MRGLRDVCGSALVPASAPGSGLEADCDKVVFVASLLNLALARIENSFLFLPALANDNLAGLW